MRLDSSEGPSSLEENVMFTTAQMGKLLLENKCLAQDIKSAFTGGFTDYRIEQISEEKLINFYVMYQELICLPVSTEGKKRLVV